jgi:hypothetical protein
LNRKKKIGKERKGNLEKLNKKRKRTCSKLKKKSLLVIKIQLVERELHAVKVARAVREQVFGREVDYRVSFIVSTAKKPIFGYLGMVYGAPLRLFFRYVF